MNFSREDIRNFLALRHLPSEHNISTTIAPNQTKLEPLETIHPELFMHIKFEENGARKGLQIVMGKLGRNKISKKKNEKC